MAEKQHKIKVLISVDASGALDVTKRVGQNLKTFGDLWSQAARKTVIAAGAVNGALAGLAIAGARTAEEIGSTAKRVGAASEAIQAIGFAAQQSETDMGAVTTAMRSLSVQAFAAATKGGDAADSFKRLGINIRTAKGELKDTTTLFTETLDKLSGIENSTTRVAIAQDLMGRSAIQMGSFIKEGSVAITNATKIIGILNAKADDTTAKLGDEVGDAFNVAKLSVQGLSFAMLRALGPALIDLALRLAGIVSVISRWVDRNPALIKQMAQIAAGVLGAATAFLAFASAAAALGALLSGMATFLAGPFGLAFLALVGIIDVTILAFRLMFDTFDEFLAWLRKIGHALVSFGVTLAKIPGEAGALGATLITMGAGFEGLASVGGKVKTKFGEMNEAFTQLKEAFKGLDVPKVDSPVDPDFTTTVDKAAEAVQSLQASFVSDAASHFAEVLKNIFELGGKIDFSKVKDTFRGVQTALDQGDPTRAVQIFEKAEDEAVAAATRGFALLEDASENIGKNISAATQNVGGAGAALHNIMAEVSRLIETEGEEGNTLIVDALTEIQRNLVDSVNAISGGTLGQLEDVFNRAQSELDKLASQASTVEKGNIDLTNRPKVKGPDGTVSTVRSISINVDGVEILIPTVSDAGQLLSNQEAIDQFLRTGAHLGKFLDAQAATNYAEALHRQQEAMVNLVQAQEDLKKNVDPTQVEALLARVQRAVDQLKILALKPEDVNPLPKATPEAETGPPIGDDEIERRAARALEITSLKAKGITNAVQLAAANALEAVGNFSTAVAQTIVADFAQIGDVLGSFVGSLIAGTTELERLSTQNRIAELHANLATTVAEQERWNAVMEETQKSIDRLELSALESTNAWSKFWLSMRQWAAKLFADLTSLIAKMLILKALSSIGPFGSLFNFFGIGFKHGGIVPALAGGGFVHGGVWGKDSVPAMLAPGELVVPADQTEQFLNRSSMSSPTIVNIRSTFLAGDKGTAREIARMVKQEIDFLETGRTL